MKQSSSFKLNRTLYILGIIVILIVISYIIVINTHDGAELTSEDIRVLNELDDIEESIFGEVADINQLQDNLSKQTHYTIDYKCSNEGSTTKSTITVGGNITHVISDYNLDVYINEENNITYTNRDGKWLKSEGTYPSLLKDIGVEAVDKIKSIGITDLSSEEIGIDNGDSSASLRHDKKTRLPVEITIEEQDVAKSYNFDYIMKEDIEIPKEVIGSADLIESIVSK